MKFRSIHYICVCMLSCWLFGAPVSVNAQEYSEEALQAEYGEDLLNLPFHIRHQFQKETGESWPRTDYDTRYEFLQSWFSAAAEREAALSKKDRDAARMAARLRREKDTERRGQQRKERAFERRERAYERAMERRRKQWEKRVKEKKEALEDMRKKQERRNRR